MKKIGTPLQEYSEERERKLEQIELRTMRKIYGNPNMSVEEMRELLRPKEEPATRVIFLKKRPKKKKE